MCEYASVLSWWMAIRQREEKEVYGAKHLTKTPFETWEKLKDYVKPTGDNEVVLFAEEEGEAELIKTKAYLTRLGGAFFAILEDHQLYELSGETMVTKWRLQWADEIKKEDILYTIKLEGVDESEDGLVVVTRDRKFFLLTDSSEA